MRTVIQRVSSAEVLVHASTVAKIGVGLLVFLGVSKDDTVEDADYLLDKLLWLRIFPDEERKIAISRISAALSWSSLNLRCTRIVEGDAAPRSTTPRLPIALVSFTST